MGSDISAYLAAARDPRAVGASADPARMRVAYLDLLKLSLCDLAGSSTGSVGRMEDGRLLSRRLVGEERELRLVGMDWRASTTSSAASSRWSATGSRGT